MHARGEARPSWGLGTRARTIHAVLYFSASGHVNKKVPISPAFPDRVGFRNLRCLVGETSRYMRTKKKPIRIPEKEIVS